MELTNEERMKLVENSRVFIDKICDICGVEIAFKFVEIIKSYTKDEIDICTILDRVDELLIDFDDVYFAFRAIIPEHVFKCVDETAHGNQHDNIFNEQCCDHCYTEGEPERRKVLREVFASVDECERVEKEKLLEQLGLTIVW